MYNNDGCSMVIIGLFLVGYIGANIHEAYYETKTKDGYRNAQVDYFHKNRKCLILKHNEQGETIYFDTCSHQQTSTYYLDAYKQGQIDAMKGLQCVFLKTNANGETVIDNLCKTK